MNIPKNIFQTWKTKILPVKYIQWSNTWKAMNPDFSYYLYDDNDCLTFIRNWYPQYKRFYLSLSPVERADIFRYLILHKYGGIYADIDTSCIRPMNELISYYPMSLITGYEYEKPVQYLQWFIACPRGCKIMIDLVDEAYRRSWYTLLRPRTHDLVYYKTGPKLYTDILRANNGSVVVLPKGILGCFDKSKHNKNTYLIHHFEGSWK
jgi:mannosyltransferase OCH1-like enzyme